MAPPHRWKARPEDILDSDIASEKARRDPARVFSNFEALAHPNPDPGRGLHPSARGTR